MEKQAALWLALCAMFLWGSWANTLLLFRTRFELYLFNYILGHFLAGFITFHDALPSLRGLGADGIWIIIVSLLAGALFAIGSLLAVASLDLAGRSAAVSKVTSALKQRHCLSKSKCLIGGLGWKDVG